MHFDNTPCKCIKNKSLARRCRKISCLYAFRGKWKREQYGTIHPTSGIQQQANRALGPLMNLQCMACSDPKSRGKCRIPGRGSYKWQKRKVGGTHTPMQKAPIRVICKLWNMNSTQTLTPTAASSRNPMIDPRRSFACSCLNQFVQWVGPKRLHWSKLSFM